MNWTTIPGALSSAVKLINDYINGSNSEYYRKVPMLTCVDYKDKVRLILTSKVNIDEVYMEAQSRGYFRVVEMDDKREACSFHILPISSVKEVIQGFDSKDVTVNEDCKRVNAFIHELASTMDANMNKLQNKSNSGLLDCRSTNGSDESSHSNVLNNSSLFN